MTNPENAQPYQGLQSAYQPAYSQSDQQRYPGGGYPQPGQPAQGYPRPGYPQHYCTFADACCAPDVATPPVLPAGRELRNFGLVSRTGPDRGTGQELASHIATPCLG